MRTCRSISRARKILTSIFLPNRKTWRTNLKAYWLSLSNVQYSSSSMLNCLTHSIYGSRQFYITYPTNEHQWFSSWLVLRVPSGKDIWWCSRCCQSMLLPQKCITFLRRAYYLSPISVSSKWSFPCPHTIYHNKYYSGLCRHYGVDFMVSVFEFKRMAHFWR